MDCLVLNPLRVKILQTLDENEKEQATIQYYKAVTQLVGNFWRGAPKGEEFLQQVHFSDFGFATFSQKKLNAYFSTLDQAQFS